jgi:hypothetical protein
MAFVDALFYWDSEHCLCNSFQIIPLQVQSIYFLSLKLWIVPEIVPATEFKYSC